MVLPQGTLSATAWLVHSNSDGSVLQVCPTCTVSLDELERRTFVDRGVLDGAGSLDGEALNGGPPDGVRREHGDPADRSVRY